MAKALDFNTLKYPTLPLVMRDEAKTRINVGAPSEGLVEELQAVAPELNAALTAGDSGSIKAIYDLAARLISCNRSGVTVTADDLRGKFRLGLEELVFFYNAYLEFITEINGAKN